MPLHLTKKPVDVEGVRWTGDNLDELREFCGDALIQGEAGHPVIKTKEGEMVVVPNAVVVKGVQGEFYPVDPEIFPETYEVPTEEAELVASTEAHWNKQQREEAPDSAWAVPEKKKLRITDKKHTTLAWDMVTRVKGLTTKEIAKARKRILAAAKKQGVDTSGWNVSNEHFEDDEAAEGAFADFPVEPTPLLPYLFGHLAEEAGEQIHAAIKTMRMGLSGQDPNSETTCRDWVVQEFNDIAGVFLLINEELVSQGVEPLTGLGDPDLVAASAQRRRDKLVFEHQAGRFSVNPPVVEE